MHRGTDDTRRHRVDTDALVPVLDRQRPRDGVQPTLGERGQRRRHTLHGLTHERCGQIYDVPGALRQHLPDGPLCDEEEAGQVHPEHMDVVGFGVLRERLGDEHPCVVDQRIDPAESRDSLPDDPISERRVGNVARNGQHVGRGIRLDGPRVSNHPIAAVEEPADQLRPDPLRRPCNDGDLALGTHGVPHDEGRIPPARMILAGRSF
jgi:hypothetical protein